MSGIAVELADEPLAIFGGALSQIVDKGFDLISAGISQGGGTAAVSCVGLHEARVELVLADQQAEAVAEARLAVVVAITSVRGDFGLISQFGCLGSGRPAELLDRTEPDALGLTEGAVDGAGFSDAHLGAMDHG